MPENKAAWITAERAHPFSIQSAPLPTAGPGELVIKNAAVAVNPVDWKIQADGHYLPKDKYPFVLGEDCAGIVEEVGKGVEGFEKGDRVISHCSNLVTQNPAYAAFQLYTTVPSSQALHIPSTLPFENAVVLPLALATAAAGLYPANGLNLPLPSTSSTQTKKTVLIWGGSSSVGSCAVQLAVASGIRVISTASAANHAFVRGMGADVVFDYRSDSVVNDIVEELKGRQFVGVYDAISEGPCFDAIAAVLGKVGKKVPVVTVLPVEGEIKTFGAVFVIAYQIFHEPNKHIGEYLWQSFVPEALEKGTLKARPDAQVVGHGLESVQEGVDVLKRGVSAKKIVVTL